MSFKDKQLLESLPVEIAALERTAAQLGAELAKPDLYRRNPTRFAEATAALQRAQAKLSAAEERWLRLETMKDELTRVR